MLKICIVLLACLSETYSQFDCPLDWVQNEQTCYKFNFYPTHGYVEATGACEADGATLLSVDDNIEHVFISSWLKNNVVNRNLNWYTSGLDVSGELKWEGDGMTVIEDHWKTDADVDRKPIETHIIYTFELTQEAYLWGWSAKMRSLPYICEISIAESFRINEERRDYTYGSKILDLGMIEKGPRFIQEPQSVMMIKESDDVYLECSAVGLPQPEYHWYKSYGTSKQVEIGYQMDDRYTMTNGRLTISKPDLSKDPGKYQCVAENKFGSIMSNPVDIVGGYLGEFSNDPVGTVRGYLYQGTFIACNTPKFNPAVNFQWYQDDVRHFVRPRLNPHMFISQNGHLYFSELQPTDAAQYHCVVTLTTPHGITMATVQPPTRASLGIGLEVVTENANNYGPLIHNDFPAVFPNQPQRGQNVRLECFAYGKLPMYYRWEREDYGIPSNVTFDDSMRIMIIHSAKLEDSGTYTCHVRRGKSNTAKKTIFLSVEAKPYFMFPLKNQHLDKGVKVSWKCITIAVPRATYTWYKDTQVLTSVPGDYEVTGNVLTIESVDKHHEGMYQCRAENNHGVTYSSAQLRILSFPPSFSKHPVKSTVGTEGGNITLICSPEGAPLPTITWKKDGSEMGLSIGASNGKHILMPNGNLVITQLGSSDAGVYTCTATNDLGSDQSSATIYITSETKLVNPPDNTRSLVNNTAFLFCQASYDSKKHDLVYIWFFYDRQVDFEMEPHYALGTRDGIHGLYIRNAQYIHQGDYKCIAQTPQDLDSGSAFLTVYGPPGEPGGVFANNIHGRDLDLRWSTGLTHGGSILMYRIQIMNHLDMKWETWKNNIDVTQVELPDNSAKKGYHVENLTPGIKYAFRVVAYNEYGYGEPSLPSIFYGITSAPPVTPLTDITGGGGSVGELSIMWEPMHEAYRAGPGFYYKVYWRKKENNFGSWLGSSRVIGDKNKFIHIVEHENYYTEYEVKVQVLNSLGAGPNSTIAVIYSAPDMPIATPSSVTASEINATAFDVFWTPIPDDRAHMKGRVNGYQVNYWLEGRTYQDALFVRHLGQADSGRVIGVTENSDYWVNVQVYNAAGLGPKSEDWRVSTWAYAPFLYPEFVNVTSRDSTSINVWWRGISTTMMEEALLGYKLRYWELSEQMAIAREVVVGKVTHAVIPNLQRGRVYKLRMLGYNYGGDGKKSPTVYFTLGGQISMDTTTTEIMAHGVPLQCSLLLVLVNLFIVSFV